MKRQIIILMVLLFKILHLWLNPKVEMLKVIPGIIRFLVTFFPGKTNSPFVFSHFQTKNDIQALKSQSPFIMRWNFGLYLQDNEESLMDFRHKSIFIFFKYHCSYHVENNRLDGWSQICPQVSPVAAFIFFFIAFFKKSTLLWYNLHKMYPVQM